MLAILLAVTTTASAAHKVEEQIVAPAWVPGTLLTLSPKGMCVASVHQKDGKWIVSINGVESQPYDDVLKAVPTLKITYMNTGEILGVDISQTGPVAFTQDGKRYAYAARSGEEVFVILDGKEIFRAKQSLSAPPVQLMQFTPDGKHLYFYNPSGDTFQSFKLMMDGKPVTPAFDKTPPLLFSEDGSHWLLHAGKAKQPADMMIIVDGKVMDYTGVMPRLTPDGKHVVCISRTEGMHKLLLDGKSVLAPDGKIIDSFKISAAGDIYAIVKYGVGTKDIYRNGKLIENATGAWEVFFSPDGKRYAAHGQTDLGKAYWVVLDGKKGPDFRRVSGIMFSPDSSVCIYSGERDDGQHLVINGEEDPKGYGILRPAFAKTGHTLVYAAGPSPMALSVYHKDKVSPLHRNVFTLEISPDGERVAYHVPVDATTSQFIVDGEVKAYGSAFGDISVFSPDSKHIAAHGRSEKGYMTLYVDDKFMPERLPLGTPQAFTPDNRHLISKDGKVYYVDGQRVATFTGRNIPWVNSPKMVRQAKPVVPFGMNSMPPDPDAVDWEVQPDGKIVFIGCVPDSSAQMIGALTKITVTPDPDTTFVTGLAAAESAYLQTIADAEAAKKKAAEDAQTAKLKAQEEAAAAAAKRKADYEAAVAAKQKARQDAIKLKTLNVQRARQGLPPLKELPPE